MEQDVREQVWDALRSDDAVAKLVSVVRGWKSDGCTNAEAELRLSSILGEVISSGTAEHDKAVREVLDFVVGFCSPQAKIFPE